MPNSVSFSGTRERLSTKPLTTAHRISGRQQPTSAGQRERRQRPEFDKCATLPFNLMGAKVAALTTNIKSTM
jgi:hypothetical protein